MLLQKGNSNFFLKNFPNNEIPFLALFDWEEFRFRERRAEGWIILRFLLSVNLNFELLTSCSPSLNRTDESERTKQDLVCGFPKFDLS